jgi:exonuclease VII large subunit
MEQARQELDQKRKQLEEELERHLGTKRQELQEQNQKQPHHTFGKRASAIGLYLPFGL